MSTKEAVARVAEELQAEITAAYRDAISTGDPEALRRAEAAERLLSRVYGRPTERVEDTRPVPAALEQLAALTADERLELLRQVTGGKRLRLAEDEAA